MKTLCAVIAISMLMAVSLVVAAESADKNLSNNGTLLSAKIHSIVLGQKPLVRSRQECISHLQEQESWPVKNHGLSKAMFVIHSQP